MVVTGQHFLNKLYKISSAVNLVFGNDCQLHKLYVMVAMYIQGVCNGCELKGIILAYSMIHLPSSGIHPLLALRGRTFCYCGRHSRKYGVVVFP